MWKQKVQSPTKASAENFPEGGQRKNSKKRPKIILLSLYIFAPCMKIQGGPRPPLPSAADAHGHLSFCLSSQNRCHFWYLEIFMLLKVVFVPNIWWYSYSNILTVLVLESWVLNSIIDNSDHRFFRTSLTSKQQASSTMHITVYFQH